MKLFAPPNTEDALVDGGAVRNDKNYAAGKIAAFQYASVAIFLFLISGYWELQVKKQESYNDLALHNSIKSLPILAPRGKILDRDGRVIVDNHSSQRLILSRETLKPEHLDGIAAGLGLDPDDLRARLAHYRTRPKYEPIVIKEELSPAEVAFVEAHRGSDFYPEMEMIEAQRRLYPQSGLGAHVIGYTGEVSESELDNPEFAKYEAGAIIGKFGLERQYNEQLTGVDGERQVVVDNIGRERRVLGFKSARPGQALNTTLDLDLMSVAELALGERRGAVVALDPRNGEVLTMVSHPAFDPNKFRVRIKSTDWRELTHDKFKPLLNRAIQAQQAPGSTFKPIMALAGLETSTVDDRWSVHCPGGASFYGHYYKCWVHSGHGTIALRGAIQHSCDVYFYTLGNKMGIDNIAFYAEQAGLGHRTGIDLPGETEGTVPSTQWKARLFREKWFAGETISVAIGQGALTVSPLQLARAIGGIAMGGVWYRPHLVKGETAGEKPHTWALNPENVEKVKDGMCAVVNEPGGTAYTSVYTPGLEMCGKTGSAQVASNDASKGNKDLQDNGWFVAFAPREKPEIAVAVYVESGLHGTTAAPIARDLVKAYFDKKAARQVTEQTRPLPSAPALLLPERP